MKLKLIVVLIVFVGFISYTCAADIGDGNFFKVLYDKIAAIVSPDQAIEGDEDQGASTVPKSVFLMELPGFPIGREDLDPDAWAAGGWNARSPSLVLSQLVNRVPRYVDGTFIDSGQTISGYWRILMRQYLVPTAESPEQKEKLDKARWDLGNSSMEEDFNSALDAYDAAFQSSLDALEQCQTENPTSAEICNQKLIIPELRLKTAWFAMETRRRDLLGAQATVLAYQMMDLKVLYAEAVQRFERQLRVDSGAVSFGTEFYQTYTNPGNFWTWWPIDSTQYDLEVSTSEVISGNPKFFSWSNIDDLPVVPADNWSDTGDYPRSVNDAQPGTEFTTSLGGKVVVCLSTTNTAPCLTSNSDDKVTNGFYYTPPSGNGADFITFLADNETSFEVSIGVAGVQAVTAESAFSAVSSSTEESKSGQSSSTSSYAVAARIKVNYGLFSGSASTNINGESASQTSYALSSNMATSFEVAKVLIVRPWLELEILAYKPVGIRGINIGGWSDGTGKKQTTTDLKFPLLPTAIIIARNIKMTSSSWSDFSSVTSSAMSTDTKVKARYGPFVSGSVSVKTSNTNRKAFQSSSMEENSLVIPGPQIIGWVCTPVPRFPTGQYQALEEQMFGVVITNFTST